MGKNRAALNLKCKTKSDEKYFIKYILSGFRARN